MPGDANRPVLACVDGSSYTQSVCEYAAWLAGALNASIRVLNVHEPQAQTPEGRPALQAVDHLRNHGVDDAEPLTIHGQFPRAIRQMAAESALVVVGKRGLGGAGDRARLGSNVDEVVRRAEGPILLAPHLFLPPSRALALLDADSEHRRAVNFLQSQPWAEALDLDAIVMSEDEAGEAKLSWARATLRPIGADVFALAATDPNQALQAYRRTQGADLLVLSREVALSGQGEQLRHIEQDSLWAWRAPLLIC